VKVADDFEPDAVIGCPIVATVWPRKECRVRAMARRLIRRFVDHRDLCYPRFDCLAAPNKAAPRIDLADSRNSRFR
jgi:hypothetical protein